MALNNNVHCLSHWEGAVGELKDFQEAEGHILAEIGPVKVLIPHDLSEELKGLKGKLIGILRTDRDYRLRIYPDNDGKSQGKVGDELRILQTDSDYGLMASE